jgi:hypothetical protein
MRWIKRIRFNRDGVSVAADVNAAIAINESESRTSQAARSVSRTTVVQDSRRADPKPPGGAQETEQEKEEHR